MIRQTTRPAIGSLTAASAVALSMLGALSGCNTPAGQFIIVQNQVPVAGCSIPASLGNEYRGSGTLDVTLVSDSASTSYDIFPIMQNNLPGPEGDQTGDPNRIALQEFQVDISLPADAPQGAVRDLFGTLATSGTNGGPDALIHYRVITSGSVASGGGLTSATVDGVPADLARRIRDTRVLGSTEFLYLLTTIRAVGKTQIKSVTSDPFVYPIKVCQDCLVANIYSCPYTAAVANTGNPCNVSQDNAIDCCTGTKGLVCPPVTQ